MCFFSTSAVYSLETIVDTFNDGLITFFDNLGDKIDILESKAVNIAKYIDNELSNSIKNKNNVTLLPTTPTTPIELSEIRVVDSDEDIHVVNYDSLIKIKELEEPSKIQSQDIQPNFIEDESWDIINDVG